MCPKHFHFFFWFPAVNAPAATARHALSRQARRFRSVVGPGPCQVRAKIHPGPQWDTTWVLRDRALTASPKPDTARVYCGTNDSIPCCCHVGRQGSTAGVARQHASVSQLQPTDNDDVPPPAQAQGTRPGTIPGVIVAIVHHRRHHRHRRRQRTTARAHCHQKYKPGSPTSTDTLPTQ